ncbi:MAG: hypothetical protein WCJ19_05475 [bacterium]
MKKKKINIALPDEIYISAADNGRITNDSSSTAMKIRIMKNIMGLEQIDDELGSDNFDFEFKVS